MTTTNKVPLLAYDKDGNAVNIGEAIVDINDVAGYFDVSGAITNPEYLEKLKLKPAYISFGKGAWGDTIQGTIVPEDS